MYYVQSRPQLDQSKPRLVPGTRAAYIYEGVHGAAARVDRVADTARKLRHSQSAADDAANTPGTRQRAAMAYGTNADAQVEESTFQEKEAAIEEDGDANKKQGYGSLAFIGLLGVACVGATVMTGRIGFGGSSATSTSELTDVIPAGGALKPGAAISETVQAVGDVGGRCGVTRTPTTKLCCFVPATGAQLRDEIPAAPDPMAPLHHPLPVCLPSPLSNQHPRCARRWTMTRMCGCWTRTTAGHSTSKSECALAACVGGGGEG